jgi:putative endonuclease
MVITARVLPCGRIGRPRREGLQHRDSMPHSSAPIASYAMRQYYVYIVASTSRCLYVGVTNDLRHRLAQHRDGKVAFTARYHIRRLVYFETTSSVMAAIRREKQIKSWSRAKRTALIRSVNPGWRDLSHGWFN